MEDSQFYSQYMYAVSLTKYESYIMGGKTNWHGDVTSRYCILFSRKSDSRIANVRLSVCLSVRPSVTKTYLASDIWFI